MWINKKDKPVVPFDSLNFGEDDIGLGMGVADKVTKIIDLPREEESHKGSKLCPI